MAAQTVASEPVYDSSKLYLWVKGLETKVNNLLRELDLLKNDLIKKNNDLRKEVKILGEELLEQKREQTKTLEKMDLIINELKQTAGKEELMVIKKYLEYWNPLNFVTSKDVERILETKTMLLRESQKSENSKNVK